MGNVLLTGATGGIGTALVSALEAAGHRVIAVGELTDVRAVVHCAGISPVEAVAESGPTPGGARWR
ncbi:NAD-dependent epimerase/dehydratase family protein [Nonomuraea spiralis]|uniref:NAD-dependent epimerase/dehydratase family protein n=1 Tax=Nonomuraea TaxID=83681 RepID=UPI0021AD7708|nr:NAD-dependent epimerase/dehydratase family protein [Nonomuraea sp. WAC 01424]